LAISAAAGKRAFDEAFTHPLGASLFQ